MPDNHCCCCQGNERCAFFVVSNPTDAPPTPTITISGVAWTYAQNGFVICGDWCTGRIPSCGGTVVSNADASVVNGTYTGLPLTPLVGSTGNEYGCLWRQSYPWFLGYTKTDCGTLNAGFPPELQCTTQTQGLGGTLSLSVSSQDPWLVAPFQNQHSVSIDLALDANVVIFASGANGGVARIGNLHLVWSTGLFTVPKCPKQTPVIPPLIFSSGNLPTTAISQFVNVQNCGVAATTSSAGSPGTASVRWA